MIQRQLEAKILQLIEHFPAVAILGARQVGKTTLAKMLMQKLPRRSIYLDLENPADLPRLENPLAFLKANQERCIIIDEVQRQPNLFPVLRTEIDRHRIPGRFLLLGSANPILLQQSSETLAGRIVYTELSGLNYLEIQPQCSLEHHWLYGGFPEPFLMQRQDIRNEWFRSFIMTYIERDLRFYGLNSDAQNMLRLLTMLAHATGGILNKSTFAKSMGKNVAAISKYVDYLVNSFILRLLPPFHVNVKKRLVKSPKAYLRDSGLRHHLLRIDDYNQLLGHPVVGHSWEGYVIEQIISVLGERYDYFFYRTQDGTECDLVITEQFQPKACVEIKFTSSPQRSKSLTIATRDLASEQNFIIIPDCSEPYPLDEHLTVCDLGQFLRLAMAWN